MLLAVFKEVPFFSITKLIVPKGFGLKRGVGFSKPVKWQNKGNYFLDASVLSINQYSVLNERVAFKRSFLIRLSEHL